MNSIHEAIGERTQNPDGAAPDRIDRAGKRARGAEGNKPDALDSGWQSLLVQFFGPSAVSSENGKGSVDYRSEAKDIAPTEQSFYASQMSLEPTGVKEVTRQPNASQTENATNVDDNKTAHVSRKGSSPAKREVKAGAALAKQMHKSMTGPSSKQENRTADIPASLLQARAQQINSEIFPLANPAREFIPGRQAGNCSEPNIIGGQGTRLTKGDDRDFTESMEIVIPNGDRAVLPIETDAANQAGESGVEDVLQAEVDGRETRASFSVDRSKSIEAASTKSKEESEASQSGRAAHALHSNGSDSIMPSYASTRTTGPADRSREHDRRGGTQEAAGVGRGTITGPKDSEMGFAHIPVKIAHTDGAVGSRQIATTDQQKPPELTTASLDRSSLHPEQQWTHAGKRIAEAGFQDPSLGWVSVRAERDATGLHAVVVPASHEAGKMLSGHLGGLNAHLAATQIPVSTVTIAAAHEGSVNSSLGSGSHRGSPDSHRHQGSEAPRSQESDRAEVSSSYSRVGFESLDRYQGAAMLSAARGFNGMHVSLVA